MRESLLTAEDATPFTRFLSTIFSMVYTGEDPRFVAQVRTLLDSKTLPCFCVVNDLTLSFQTDAESLGQLQNLITNRGS